MAGRAVSRKFTVIVERVPERGYALECPFDRRLVDAIHRYVPLERRFFDHELRLWWISSAEDYARLMWSCQEWAVFTPRRQGRRGKRA